MDDDSSRPSTAQKFVRRMPGSLDNLNGSTSMSMSAESTHSITQSHSAPALAAAAAPATTPSGTPGGASLKPENVPPLHPPARAPAGGSPSSLSPPGSDSSYMDGTSLAIPGAGKHSDSFNEHVVRQHLQDVESSFTAPLSPLPTIVPENGVDDTYVFDSPTKRVGQSRQPQAQAQPAATSSEHRSWSSYTPPSGLPTVLKHQPEQRPVDVPVVRTDDSYLHANTTSNTSSLETFSSSPTAAAAARTISRAISHTSAGRSHNGSDNEGSYYPARTSPSPPKLDTPPEEHTSQYLDAPATSLRYESSDQDLHRLSVDAGSTPGQALRIGKRPRYLRTRNASQRSSVSSFNTVTDHDDVESDVTVGLGVDYALQSGGAVPALGMSRSISNMLSRSISMGSMGSIASGIDDLHDSSGRAVGPLETLEEVDVSMSPGRGDGQDEDHLQTPKPSRGKLSAPTDTVLARRVMDVHVPESLAKEYKSKGGLITPRKSSEYGGRGASTTGRSGRNLTLKEQSSTIERLSKENFDLKLKVMFLSDRLDKLSEEGIKEMISENVDLKTSLAVLQRDNKVLRRRVKELEKQARDEDDRPGTARSGISDTDQASETFDQDAQEREEELIYLRERVEEYINEIEILRHENLTKEADRRRMADVVKTFQSMGERTMGDSLGRQEEADVWKDLLEQETARREQADDDNRRLREEMFRLKQEMAANLGGGGGGGGGVPMHHTTNIYNISKKARDAGASPNRVPTDTPADIDGVNGALSTATTLVEELRKESEQLRHENAELRREVGAQTSMLTSRNREKERLYQEIEDLKMAQRRGGAAPSTIDSLLERSASRAGGNDDLASRNSGGTRTQMDEAEREELENKLAELRDKINEIKLQNQDLQQELDTCMDDFEAAIDGKKQAEETVMQLQEDVDNAMNDLMALQAERDEALRDHGELENEFESLQKEAQEEIDAMEAEADQHNEEIRRLQLELNDRSENFDALQEEMRKMSEALVRLEDEQVNKLRRVQQLESELDGANKELEELEAKLLEANDKNQRLSVQQESSQGEIAFLREEQEGDKIRIGNLEADLAKLEQSLRDEKDRVKELDARIEGERRQREFVASREKEEVEQLFNELNHEMTTAKDEARQLRKKLASKGVEATEWKERLIELENNLREALGDLNGTRSSLLKSIAQLQRELENTVRELDTAKASLMEKDRIIKQRDGLLESQSLESRRLTESLEKERQAHRNTKNQFETFQKTHQHVSRTVTSQDARIGELEMIKAQDKKRILQLETTFRDQLQERNSLLLILWSRLSALCGSDWAHGNSLINGRALPSLETVVTMFPGFSKNLLAAIKTIETMMNSFQARIKDVEKDLWREYQNLESSLDLRVKKLDKIETIVRSGVASGALGGPTEREMQRRIVRLEEACRQLEVDNATLRAAREARARAAAFSADSGNVMYENLGDGSPAPSVPTGPRDRIKDRSRRPGTRSNNGSRPPTMARATSSHRSAAPMTVGELALAESDLPGGPVIDDDDNHSSDTGMPPLQQQHSSQQQQQQQQQSQQPQQQYSSAEPWMFRLRDLEGKLKKEREGRAEDRTEARMRIRQLEAERNEEAARVEREIMRGRMMGQGGGR